MISTKRWWVIGIVIGLLVVRSAATQPQRVVTYGADLTPEEEVIVFRDFPLPQGIGPKDIKSIKVTNEEEWRLFEGLVPAEQIGTKSVSSVYLEKLEPGAGIKVETKNLTYITPHIFANTLATAGISDARVYATAPQPVSGTAALTGIYKSFETLTGSSIPSGTKRIGALELIDTGYLGEKVGPEQAAILVERCKERLLSVRITTKTEALRIVDQGVRDQNLKLTPEEKSELADLLLKIGSLNPDLTRLKTQLRNFTQRQNETQPQTAPQSFLSRLIAYIQSLIKQLVSFVGRIGSGFR